MFAAFQYEFGGQEYNQTLVNRVENGVIDAAKKELDESSPYSFVAKEEKEGKKVIGWTLFPVFFEDREDPALPVSYTHLHFLPLKD